MHFQKITFHGQIAGFQFAQVVGVPVGWCSGGRLSGLCFQHYFCQTPVLGLGLGVDFTFDNVNDNPHLNFVKGTVLGDKEEGVGIRD